METIFSLGMRLKPLDAGGAPSSAFQVAGITEAALPIQGAHSAQFRKVKCSTWWPKPASQTKKLKQELACLKPIANASATIYSKPTYKNHSLLE